QDFYDLMSAYLARAAGDGVRRAEIFFDPQTHTMRGVDFGVFMEGFNAAIADASHAIDAALIMCFLRHLSPEEAETTLSAAEPYLDDLVAVGLDSSERGRPPELFTEVYRRSRDLGLRAVAHAGEEGPPEYVWSAIDVLGAERIEHGVRSLEDSDLVERLGIDQIPLTVCPLSNVALQVVDSLADHPVRTMIDSGLRVSVNSDDPAYFGGYVGDNYEQLALQGGFDGADLVELARMSIVSTFLSDEEKSALLSDLETVAADL
ncbi:MAG: adenosine deaminase, partial [Acidimicrobiia bacterium]|nr:adenosine deaminase [Acidimicrobiia bacterium]